MRRASMQMFGHRSIFRSCPVSDFGLCATAESSQRCLLSKLVGHTWTTGFRFILGVILSIALHRQLPAQVNHGPQRPEDELKSFRFADDQLTIELIAAEPDVVSPVAMAWDERGRLFIAEMSDYPAETTGGRIKLLEDRDQDGHYETISIFADKLSFPNGVLPWNDGVLVTAAPNIWFLKDTDDDGKADERRVILTGFAEGNQQLRVNGLFWGLDNWVYGANGRSDGQVRSPNQPANQAVSLRLHDFRFRPDTGEVQIVSGFSQFGLAHDDWGNRFTSWNTIPIRHVVLEERYLSRNPNLALTASVASILDPADTGRVYSISPPPTTFNREPVDYFNASCGLTIHRGDGLGAEYKGNAFVCESLTNLVHRRVLTPAGQTFVASRGEMEKEFLASTDSWFHPVNLTTGPDGCLYVADFYRQSVEHPQFVPEPIRKTIDFRVGTDHGRVWRIRRKSEPAAKLARLDQATAAQLVDSLGNTNGWVRDTAQRMLVTRKDAAAVLLKEAAIKSSSPLARSHALWTLHGLGQLDESTLNAAMKNSSAEVREQALIAAERQVATSPSIQSALQRLVDDSNSRVRYRTAISLGDVSATDSTRQLAVIANRDSDDEWTRLAILSSLGQTATPFLRSLVESHPEWLKSPSNTQSQFLSDVAALVGASNREVELAEALSLLQLDQPTINPGNLAVFVGLTEGLARKGKSLKQLSQNPSPQLAKSLASLPKLIEVSRAMATEDGRTVSHRILAFKSLIEIDLDAASPVLLELLQPNQPEALQTTAARGLAIVGSKGLAMQALEGWNSYTTGTRREILASLLRTAELATALIEGIEQEKLAAAELDASAQEVLRRIPSAELKTKVEELFPKNQSDDREAVVQSYQPVLELKGQNTRGAELFSKTCVTCHQVRGKGQRVGPDLSGTRSRPKAALLSDILNPNKDVEPDYRSFVLINNRGQVSTGILAAETATSITLRRAQGAEDSVLRSEIAEFRPSGKTLMPEGLERTLSQQDIADILEFLHNPIALP